MLETVREYARGRLAERGDAPAVHRAHAEHFLGLAERAEPELTGPAAGAWLEGLELEHDNFRAALAWAGGEPRRHELELRLGVALQYFWRLRGHLSEGRRWLEAAVERGLEAPPALRAKALVAGAVFVDRHGDHAGARRRYEEALELFRGAGDDRGVARTLSELGAMSIVEEDYPRAIELYDETLPYFRESGDVRALAVTLSNLASVYGLQRDFERAHSLGLEALAIAREHGDRDQLAISLYNLGRNALARADRQEAAAFLGESLEVGVELGYRELLAYCLLGCGELAAAAGEAGTAARLLGAGDAHFRLLGVAPGVEERQGRDDALTALRERLGGEELERLLAEGGGLEQATAIDVALELVRTVAGR
jgi:tetratricopeptide (TPR) repeat protein